MIVIANNTEKKLEHDLNVLKNKNSEKRCFYIEFSRTDIPKEKLFEKFLRALEDVPDSYKANVYLCSDKDILILMEGFMKRSFIDFIGRLSAQFDGYNFSDLIHVYGIGSDWTQLEKLYSEKNQYIVGAVEAAEEERKTTVNENILEAFLELDPAMKGNIHQRRSERPRPLVMIADDDQVSRSLAGNALRGDYELSFAANGKETLTEFVLSAPDILFLDIGMPDINGHDVLESLFMIDPNAYVIMFSGRKDKSTIMKSLEIGAQGFLGKPFTYDQLCTYSRNSPFVQVKRGA